jgi:nucleoside-diphosphate-sugar epimerase
MENLIKENSDNYLIFKLPQVIGESGNKTNLINYLINSITNEDEIVIYENISRSLIDVDDVVSIVHFCKKKVKNKTLNVSGIEKISVLNLCKKIGRILKKPPIIIIRETGNSYDEWGVENSVIVKKNLDEPKGYTNRILKKYIL